MTTVLTYEPLEELFTRSRWLTLDFSNISPDIPASQNIQAFFEACRRAGIDPKAPEQRQQFNNKVLEETNTRYLVSRYGEDRSAMLAGSAIAQEGRTLHLGVDVFCRDLETVYAPCDGEIIAVGKEPENHSFGHYAVLKPYDTPHYLFFGHLSTRLPSLGQIRAGDAIGQVGDFHNGENGGWSRHLHLQVFRRAPLSETELIGYSTGADFAKNARLYPSPMTLFSEWHPTQDSHTNTPQQPLHTKQR